MQNDFKSTGVNHDLLYAHISMDNLEQNERIINIGIHGPSDWL